MNALGQTMIMDHAVHMQVFHADHAKTVYDLTAFLMREVIPSEGDTLMHTSHNLAMLAPFRRAFCKLGVCALHLRKGLLFLAEKARVCNLFCIGKCGKGLQSHINANLSRGFWQTLRLTLDREGHVPFACAISLNSTGFDRALDGTVVDHLDRANLGECHTIIMGETEATLREGEAIIAVTAPKAREARRFTGFAASEKGFEGQINAHSNVLQDLGMSRREGRPICFQ